MNCYSFPLRCFKKVILRLCENSDLIYEIFTLGKRGVTRSTLICKGYEQGQVSLLIKMVLMDNKVV